MELHAVRLYLMKELNPSGNLDITIKKGSTTIYTETKTISSIIAASSLMTTTNYFHGFTTWELTRPIRLDREVTYTLVLEGTNGYTSGFSWVKEYENVTNNFTTTISNLLAYPHSIQLWNKKDYGMIRVLDFTDGFTSASVPTGSTIVAANYEVDFDGFIYHRQNTGVDTADDWRVKTISGVRSIEEYDGASWVEKEAALT